MGQEGLELYIHIPFCARKCLYCDFLSFEADEQIRAAYVTALCGEMHSASEAVSDRVVETVYLGGGTPSLLTPAQIRVIMKTVQSSFTLDEEAEISIECNPGTVDAAKLAAMRESGINRVSFGLQSADEAELEMLGRIHRWDEFERSFAMAREAGFDNISVDLMFALPGQNPAVFKRSLLKVTELEPEHISVYSLIPEEGTPIGDRINSGGIKASDEKTDRKMYRDANRLLKNCGYERYEISNFARPGRECRHNEGYWTGREYLGFGLGASGYFGGVRYRNEADITEYLKRPAGDGVLRFAPAAAEHHELSVREKIEEFMFLGLRRSSGVSEAEFRKRFIYDMDELYGDTLRQLRAERLLKKAKDRWSLSAKGIDVSNAVLARFLLDSMPLPAHRLSVRTLVEFMLRSGDLDRVSVSGASVIEAMHLGSAIHRRLQSERPAGYQAEVPLSLTLDLDKVRLTVEGRADGIGTLTAGDGTVMIEEIKSVSGQVSRKEGPKEVHLAQAKCYAAIYAHDHSIPEIAVRVTYCHTETKKITEWDYTYDSAALWEWLLKLVRGYEKWAVLRAQGRIRRDQSIRELSFPFEYREGQKRLVSGIYQTIRRGRQLFVQAPTGAGKTIAALYPAVRALGEGEISRIWYLTAKTVTRSVAQEAIQIMMRDGLCMYSVTMTARDKICLCDEAVCDPEVCPYAKGHFDRVNDALYDLLTEGYLIDRSRVAETAEKHRVCPYELEKDAAGFCDAVICDYNYVLDPSARLVGYFMDGRSKSDLFLIDEAHNLIERARSMYSASISKSDLLALRRLLKETGEEEDGGSSKRRGTSHESSCRKKLKSQLGRLNRCMLEWKGEPYELAVLTPEDVPADQITALRFAMDGWLEANEKSGAPVPDLFWDLYFAVCHFQNMYEGMDERYRVCARTGNRGSVTLNLYCIDPSMMLSAYLLQGRATVFFSATMLPIPYYEKLLTVSEDIYDMYAQSPFDPGHLRLLIGTDVTSLYQSRGETMYRRYARYICEAVTAREGNYLVFFPSYAFMEQVAAYLPAGTARWIRQTPSMTEQEKEEFLSAFGEKEGESNDLPSGRGGSLAGLCVLGGAFSEGIDLRGHSLIGVIVIGTGIPQVGARLNLTKEYFDESGMDGFAYTYVYPGFNKVMQAVGRVIRTADDAGVALLLDERFNQSRYRRLFPREWTQVETCTVDDVGGRLKEYWEIL